MNKIITLRNDIFCKINDLLKSKNLIVIWGKSGSGKSILLQRLSKYHEVDYINEIFNNEKDFKNLIIKNQCDIIILDEVGMYEQNILELIRIYSDKKSFILSSHKKIKLFEQEHFKSRIRAVFHLKELNLKEMGEYIILKFNINFSKKAMNFIMKIYQGNLRNVDKMLKSFCELNHYLKNQKSQEYILKLSALENGLLR